MFFSSFLFNLGGPVENQGMKEGEGDTYTGEIVDSKVKILKKKNAKSEKDSAARCTGVCCRNLDEIS